MGLSRKGWVLLTTVIFISLIFAFYFLVYVKGNERKIVNDNLRVLAQMKINIENLLDNVRKRGAIEADSPDPSLNMPDPSRFLTLDSIFDSKQLDFFWGPYRAVWRINRIEENIIFEKEYHELLQNDLIERRDIFEFIAISTVEGRALKNIFSNAPLGQINYPNDSTTLANFTSKNFFEIDFGYNQYLAFNTQMGSYDNYEVYLTGYVNKTRFNEEKREVSVFFITFAIILTILMILAFPILKLRIMNNEERLNRKDVLFAGVSLAFGPVILILLFLFFSTNMFVDKNQETEKLEEINEKLAENFNSELRKAIVQLKHVTGLLDDNIDLDDPNTLGKGPLFDSLSKGKFNQYVLTNAWYKDYFTDSGFRYFNSIFWTDSLGRIKIYLSSEKDPNLIESLSHRRYVMDIVNGQYLDYKGDPIAFESIRSVSDGNYEIGLGTFSGNKHLPVLAASFSLVSLMNPILEEGYGFCLFNSKGETLFHSDIQRNLNENFLDETGAIFNAYLKSGVSHHTSVTYMDQDHDMYLKKIPELDGYFLATFVEEAYTHSPNAIAINMTIEMQIAFFTLLFLFYLILYASALKRSKLKQRVFLFNWLKPFAGFEGSNKYLYIKLLGVNILVFAYMLISWGNFYRSPDLLIYSILSSGVLLLALNFWKLSIALPDNERMYTQFHDKRSLNFIGLFIGLVALLLFIGKIYLIKFHLFSPQVIIDVVILILTGYGIYQVLNLNLDEKNQPKIISFFQNKNLLDYKLFVYSLIVLFSVLPTLMFFSINYKKEKEILFKHNAMALKQKKEHWKEEKKAQFYQENKGVQKSIIDSLDNFVGEMEVGSLNYAIPSSLEFEENLLNTPDSLNKPDSFLYDHLYDKARIEFDSYGVNSQGFIKNGNSTNWVFDRGGVDFYNTMERERITGPVNTLSKHGWLIFIFLIIMLYAIYGILKTVVHKIFGLDFKDYADKLVLTETYKEIGNKLVSIYEKADAKKDSFNNSFIVGVNASHVYEIKEILQNWKKEKFFNMELLDLPNVMEDIANDPNQHQEDYFTNFVLNFQILIKTLVKSNNHNDNYLIKALNDKHKLPNSSLMVFIEHFEFAYDTLQLNKVKLNILQRLVSNPSIRVVISSEISPIKIYEFYEDSIKKMEAVASKSHENILENRERIEDVKADYKKWLHLLGGFFRITIPIEKKKNEYKIKTLNEELKHGQYLDRISNKYNALYRQMDSCDDYILNIQETSYSYYFAIWNSLSKEERYIVYDIAHDNFVNTNNVDGIIDLLQKGILIYDHSLRLMNESFTNFVLAKVNSDEALERELESAKGGKWNTTSAVFLLIIISLIVFISFGKINMLEDVNALLGSLAAIFTLLLRMGGIFVLGKGPN